MSKLFCVTLFLGSFLFAVTIANQLDFTKLSNLVSLSDNGSKVRDLIKETTDKAEIHRQKRSVNASVKVTKMNQTDYQQLEIQGSTDQDPRKMKARACLVQDNEVYWLELVSSALVQIMQEMKHVLEGKKVAMKMTKGAYEESKQASEKARMRH
ncbi:conserved hypothetical protein [Culex quinquefasciatus]|uniref:Uncharacterized protein n=1 Tax=Culex quinquefasciatus TaxID=7176 RepID=B0X3I1_CULQU|nr:conserved hypothetical protein [Culex quinquefasciatus]|eukprot:XP_001864203.1 conserved hypothetical protein [Culex quinquefasciatus]